VQLQLISSHHLISRGSIDDTTQRGRLFTPKIIFMLDGLEKQTIEQLGELVAQPSGA